MQARACQRNPKCGYLCAQRNASASAKMLGTTFLTGSTRCSPSIMFFIELSSSTAIIILQDHYIPSLPYTMQWYSSLPVIQVIYYSVIIPVIYLYPSDTSYTSSIPLLHSDTCKIPLYHAVVYLYNISASSIPVIYLCYLSIYIPVIYLYNTMQQYLSIYTSSIYHAVIPLLPLYIYQWCLYTSTSATSLYQYTYLSLSIIYIP